MRGKCEWEFNATTTIGEVAKTFQVTEVPTKLIAIALVFEDIAKNGNSIHFFGIANALTLSLRVQYEQTLRHFNKSDDWIVRKVLPNSVAGSKGLVLAARCDPGEADLEDLSSPDMFRLRYIHSWKYTTKNPG